MSDVARKPREFDPVTVRNISVRVYRERLCKASGAGADLRMIAKDQDHGEKLRARAASYDSLTRSYLRAIKGGAP